MKTFIIKKNKKEIWLPFSLFKAFGLLEEKVHFRLVMNLMKIIRS